MSSLGTCRPRLVAGDVHFDDLNASFQSCLAGGGDVDGLIVARTASSNPGTNELEPVPVEPARFGVNTTSQTRQRAWEVPCGPKGRGGNSKVCCSFPSTVSASIALDAALESLAFFSTLCEIIE